MISVLFTLGGLWTVISGKLPTWLYGGKEYRVDGAGARLLGLVLIAPLFLAITLGVTLTLVGMGEQQADNISFLVELVSVGLAALVVIIVSRRIRRRADGMPLTEADRRFSLGNYWQSRNWVFKSFVIILLFFFVVVPIMALGLTLLGG
jgi:hypothetical protein